MLQRSTGPTYYARLQFEDAASCAEWLDGIAHHPAEAHEMVAAQIRLVGRSDLPTPERLRILETLYPRATSLQAELTAQYLGCALPLSIVEYSLWRSVVELWQSLFASYELLLRRAFKGDRGLETHTPLLALRAIELTAAAIQAHHQVYRSVPSMLWRQLHQSYAFAERHGIAAAAIAADSVPLASRTPAAVYAGALLAHLSNPYTMSPRQMAVMYRWAGLWAPLVGIGPSPIPPGMSTVLAVDLKSSAPAVPARQIEAESTMRYVGLERLGEDLRRTLALLRQGESPTSLGLGEDLRQPGCERLLTLLYIQWCGTGLGHIDTARERGEDARAAVGLAAVCRQLSLESEAFRSTAIPIGAAANLFTEQWYVAGTSAPGFLAVARGPECDERIRHHQLVAVRRRSAAHLQLAVVQSLRLDEDGDLAVGLRLLPGVPHVSPIRPPAAADDADAPPAAILLPAAPEVRSPATLVLAPSIFEPGRELELLSGTIRRVKLVQLIERGSDFERVAFEVVA